MRELFPPWVTLPPSIPLPQAKPIAFLAIWQSASFTFFFSRFPQREHRLDGKDDEEYYPFPESEYPEYYERARSHIRPVFVVSDVNARRDCNTWSEVQEVVYDWYSFLAEEPDLEKAKEIDLTIDIFDLEEEDIEIANARIREREREIVRELFGEYRPDSMNVLRIQHDYRIF